MAPALWLWVPVGGIQRPGAGVDGRRITEKQPVDSQYRALNIVRWKTLFLIANRHHSVYAVYPIEFEG